SVLSIPLIAVIISLLLPGRYPEDFNGSHVTLESVKKLGELLDQSGGFNNQLRAQRNSIVLCNNPVLPFDLQSVCENDQTVSNLGTIAQDDYAICVNVMLR
uniref:Guanylate cyclase activator 2B n=1 Tax=Vombatus ursinus TaxID=29139 RepID=A0A4X2KM34_VOMUR